MENTGFFADVVQPSKKGEVTVEFSEEFCLVLNSAALSHDAKPGRTTLYCTIEDRKFALCTLEVGKTEQWNLQQTFTMNDAKVVFTVEGVNAVHLTGVIQFPEDDEDDELDFDALMDDEEEQLETIEEDEEDDDKMDDKDDEPRFVEIEQPAGEPQPEDEPVAEKPKAKETPKTKAAAAKPQKEAVAPTPEKDAEPKLSKKQQRKLKQQQKKEEAAKKQQEQQNDTPKKETPKKETPKKETSKAATPKTESKKREAESKDSLPVPKKAKSTKVVKGVTIEEQAVGTGPQAKRGKRVKILYRGTLENGKQFDANKNRKNPFSFRMGLGEVIKGMDIGLEGMRVGGKRKLTIPSKLGYGKQGAPPSIPGHATLIFEIELVGL